MRLTQLQIKGFKSFADETVINFNEQIIGVVGPNGSGKSNIVDAIKWVLGEHKTKELRLESMQDVIFNGTKERKKGRVARVTLNFDNTKNILPTEYNSVSISRVLYSSGQSEYRLNDVQCRKKDITSLFLDSGLGSNAYAIISLNMVEDILVDRENSRSRMIEEASGINKFKVRKKETLNKLKGTQGDLDRVEDLLFELESNLKAFEKQARRTERYLKIKEEFKLISLSWASRNGKQLKNEIGELKNNLDDDQKREVKITGEIAIKEAALQKVKKQVLEKEGQLSDFQRTHNKLKDRISILENQKGIAQNELTFLNTNLNNAESGSSLLEKEIAILVKELVIKENVKEEQSSILQKVKEEYKLKIHAYNAIKKVYDSIRHNLVSGEKEKNQLRSRIENSKRDISVKQSQISLLEEQLTAKKIEGNSITEQLEDIENNLFEIDTKHKKVEHAFEEQCLICNKKQDQLERELIDINDKKEVLRRTELKRDKAVQRAEILENVINNYEGFTESIQYLNSEKKINKQLLSDVIEINDNSYQEIIELFFAPILQHVVVDSPDIAYSLNSLVRGAQKGKVNFLVKNNYDFIHSSTMNKRFTPLESFLNIDKKHEKIIKSITSNAYIYKGSFEELLIETIGDDDVILVSKEFLIYKNGELRGGSATLFEGVNIGRRKNLSDLRRQIEKFEKSVTHLNQGIEQGTIGKEKIATLIEIELVEKEKLREELITLENQKNIIRTRLNVRSNIATELAEKNKGAQKHIANVQSELDALIALSYIFSEKTLEEDNIEEMKSDFDKYHEEFELARTQKEKIQEQIFKNENLLNLTLRDIDQINRDKKEKTSRQSENKNIIRENNIRIKELLVTLEEIKKKVVGLYANEKEQFQQLNSHEEKYFSAKSGIYDQEKDIFELRGKRDKLTHFIAAINEKLNDKKIKFTGWKDRIEVEFSEDISKYTVLEEYINVGLDELGSQRENLQIKIKSYGDINPLAIEAYNEIKLRVERITTERDDIVDAKVNLEETIKDIEQTASDLFTESLDQVRVHFKDVFQSLFSDGDDCDIVLLNADNPLDSRIEIVAKPKGKKPKSINQLSGGEKTLTAVSFLFALYLLKPAPFCIFDEVDAPLDDINIQKFNKIIKKFSQDSQFIIVTHNKATMSEMDILYGVFMQETGVSGVAAVDFRDFNKVDIFPSK
ncbi:MAG: chromosome segregation protein SMC [Saprospiraceae bacterium]